MPFIALTDVRVRRRRRLTEDLESRVRHRTAELAAANDALRREIAERQRAQDALGRRIAFLAEGERLARIGSFSWRVADDCITWSDQVYHIFGGDRTLTPTLALIGALVHPDDLSLLDAVIRQARRAAADFECEVRLPMPNKTVRYVRLVAHATVAADGQLEYVGAMQDVTRDRSPDRANDAARSAMTAVSGVVRRSIDGGRPSLERQVEINVVRDHYASLSRREREVMALVVTGLLNKQVAGELGISEITVKAHRGRVMRKMQAGSLAGLVRMGADLGLAPVARTERALPGA